MLEKIKTLLGSIRFWLITIAWLGVYLAVVEKSGFQLPELFTQIGIWLGSIATVGTVDKFSKK